MAFLKFLPGVGLIPGGMAGRGRTDKAALEGILPYGKKTVGSLAEMARCLDALTMFRHVLRKRCKKMGN